jgi:hypothetical protein
MEEPKMKKENKMTTVEVVLTANEIKELKRRTQEYEFKSIDAYVRFRLFVIWPILEKIEQLFDLVKKI